MGIFYRATREVLRTGLRAFFRDIEVQGRDHLPWEGPCIVAANHHNSLMDPFLLFAVLDRPLCFIAKAPLFRIPVFGAILRRLGCIPAHRSQDAGYAKEKNEELYRSAAQVLTAGPALAIFPEGRSHSEPQLADFRHGASRIALETESLHPGVRIQLVGIHFEETRGFRGRVLVRLGPPVAVEAHRERYEREPREAIAALTGELQARLSEMILTAESEEILRLAALLSRMRAIEEVGRPHQTAEAFDRKKLILDRHRLLRERAPREVEAIRLRLLRYESLLGRLGLEEEAVAAEYRPGPVLRSAAVNTALLGVELPFLALGIAVNYVPFLLSALVSRMSGSLPDRRASGGFLAGLVAFPAAWVTLAWVLWRRWGPGPGIGAAAVCPLLALLALRGMDRWHRAFVQTWGIWSALAHPRARRVLRIIRRTILERADRLRESLGIGVDPA
jgi:1-acyl-sn-glycerol-3-phosphate acyltransferase